MEVSGWREQDDHILHKIMEVDMDTMNNWGSLELQMAETETSSLVEG